jgi:hypothetical protein
MVHRAYWRLKVLDGYQDGYSLRGPTVIILDLDFMVTLDAAPFFLIVLDISRALFTYNYC